MADIVDWRIKWLKMNQWWGEGNTELIDEAWVGSN
jgi:hypothetical protein